MFRWFALAVLVGSVTISGYHRHWAHVQGESVRRRDEGFLLLGSRLFLAFPLFGGVVTYVAYPPWMAWASFETFIWVRWLGVGVGLATLPTIYWVLRTLGQNVSATVFTKDRHELVTSGPYRWIRHPLYTTGVTVFGALGLIAANWFILLFTLLVFLLVRLVVVPREERELLDRFGSEYEDYMRRTGAMMPPLR